jgi:fructose-bisphosphate aldolase/6-deoxy-5-ketofructose 1-phosphate synthase
MKKLMEGDVLVPADVPTEYKATYIRNYLDATKCTGRLFLYAGDQKIEHLNDDFYGPFDEGVIPLDDADPEHLFRIAKHAKQYIGFFATQYGLLARYARDYSDVPYLVKMNSKSHLVSTKQKDPVSAQLVSFEDVLLLQKNSGLRIVGVGYTVYLGSEYEPQMLGEASRLVAAAHRQGMLVVLWMYPRGAAVPDEKNPHVIAGAAGVACCLGADFAKVNYPKREGVASEEIFKEAILAAGRTGVITSGGSSTDVRKFLERLYKQIHVSGCIGNATGRNIHQKPLENALAMCAAVAAVTYGDKDADFAMKVYEGTEVFSL